MKQIGKQIIIWLGIMAILTVLAMGVWMVIWGGSQSTESLKWLQFMQTLGTFFLPAVLCAWMWDEHHQPMAWLGLNKGANWQFFLIAIGIMICAIPGINLLADLNGRVDLPECLDSIEQKFKEYEESAALLTERFLAADNIGELLLNVGLMALLPAFSEEISFRGTLQQIIYRQKTASLQEQRAKTDLGAHVAIWVTAFIFSAIHMQFYGFVPRMLMGAMFGYVFVWSGSLWIPIVMHFMNNGLAVVVYYFTSGKSTDETAQNIADTIGAGDTWWLGVLSLVITCLGLLIFYRRTHKQ